MGDLFSAGLFRQFTGQMGKGAADKITDGVMQYRHTPPGALATRSEVRAPGQLLTALRGSVSPARNRCAGKLTAAV